jgi:hypothetical protein
MNGWQWPRHGGWRSLCVFLVVIVVGCRPESGESQNDPDMERATESADPHLAESQAPRDPGVASGDQVSRPSALDRYLEFARGAVSGERAREMVASVDPSYRVPGNRFFDEAIGGVVEVLEASGYRDEAAAAGSPLTYRIERRELSLPTWEPVRASLAIEGSETPLMELESNINLVAAYSHPTPGGGVNAEVVYVGEGNEEDFDGKEVEGRIVFGETSVGQLFRRAVQARGALGVLAYRLPAFNRPEENRDIAPMSSIPFDSAAASWGLLLSGNARDDLLDALTSGPVRLHVEVETRLYPSEELTLVAQVQGSRVPEERFVLSAHVQESGANDNASGVAAQAEIARALAEGVQTGVFAPHRSVTMIWGDEIRSTQRFLEEDSIRAQGVRWGMSLDMVGEDTDKTGGTFLIEKMPDPSAVWTRGEDQHTEWGGRPLTTDQLTPHYLNDFVLKRCQDQAAGSSWVVRTNPYEGGSDHVPFLRAGTAGILLWHFTDQYYHTDGDRLDVVSPTTLWNVGVCATVSAMVLTTVDDQMAGYLVGEVERSALARLDTEGRLSRGQVATGGDPREEREILETWTNWYQGALDAMKDLEAGGASSSTLRAIEDARSRVAQFGEEQVEGLVRRE